MQISEWVQKPRMRHTVLLILSSNSGRRERGQGPDIVFQLLANQRGESTCGTGPASSGKQACHTAHQPIRKETWGLKGRTSGWRMPRTRPLHMSANHERRTKKMMMGLDQQLVHLIPKLCTPSWLSINREWKQGNRFFFSFFQYFENVTLMSPGFPIISD